MWKTKKSEIVHQNPWFTVTCDEIIRHNDMEAEYYVVHTKPAVFIVPQDSDGSLFLIKQFRYPNKSISWELPAGAIDTNENSLEAGKRELLEETGLRADNWEWAGIMYLAPGLTNHQCQLYKATGLTQVKRDVQHDEAIIECKNFSIEEIKQLIRNEEMTDGPTMAVLNKVILSK